MKKSGFVNTSRPAYDPLEDGHIIAPRPNRYNQVSNLVLADRKGELTTTEQGVLSSALASAGEMIAHRQMSHHAGQQDSALGNALASLAYSIAYGVAIAMITAALVILAWIVLGGDEGLYALAWLGAWGVCCLGALAYNRWQGLWFSPAGLGHHEIDSRERVAMHAIDKHTDIIEQRLGFVGNGTQLVGTLSSRRLTG